MLLKILGWFWIVTGILGVLNPEMMQNRMKKKSIKKVRKFFFGLVLILSGLLIKATWGLSGLLAKVMMVLGCVGIVKAFFLLKAKAADALVEWYVGRSTTFFRVSAVIQVVLGVVILWVK